MEHRFFRRVMPDAIGGTTLPSTGLCSRPFVCPFLIGLVVGVRAAGTHRHSQRNEGFLIRTVRCAESAVCRKKTRKPPSQGTHFVDGKTGRSFVAATEKPALRRERVFSSGFLDLEQTKIHPRHAQHSKDNSLSRSTDSRVRLLRRKEQGIQSVRELQTFIRANVYEQKRGPTCFPSIFCAALETVPTAAASARSLAAKRWRLPLALALPFGLGFFLARGSSRTLAGWNLASQGYENPLDQRLPLTSDCVDLPGPPHGISTRDSHPRFCTTVVVRWRPSTSSDPCPSLDLCVAIALLLCGS